MKEKTSSCCPLPDCTTFHQTVSDIQRSSADEVIVTAEKTTTTGTTMKESEDNQRGVAYVLADGKTVVLESEPSNYATGTSTGWMTWNASVVLCDYLETRVLVDQGRGNDSNNSNDSNDSTRVADVSSGNGLVAVCLARLGCESVVATETTECVELTRRNAELNQVDDVVDVHAYYWGTGRNPCIGCHLVTMSDLLYIALRDNLKQELETTIRDLCESGSVLYFAFEQRLWEEEEEFMKMLGEANGERKSLVVNKIPACDINLARLQPVDGVEMLMWEDPPIKMYIIRC